MALKLNPDEHSILARFRSFPRAQEARAALRAAGLATVQVDRVGASGYNPVPGYFPPGQGEGTSLSGITYFDAPAEDADREESPLHAAMPEASGMAGPLTARGHGVLLTAVVPADRLEEALAVIRAHGGNC